MVLASPRAMEVSVYVVRAFVRLRKTALQHKDVTKRLDALEEKTESLAMQHDAFSRNTRAHLRQVFEALRELTVPPEPARRPIRFMPPEEKNKPAGKAAGKAAAHRKV